MEIGTIIWFSRSGYGFIAPDDDTGEVMMHRSQSEQVLGQLRPGQRVEFRAVAGTRGRRAETLRLA